MTWIFNHTRGSVLIAYLAHSAVNTWSQVIPVNPAHESSLLLVWLQVGVVCTAAAIVVRVFGAARLARAASAELDAKS